MNQYERTIRYEFTALSKLHTYTKSPFGEVLIILSLQVILT